MKEIKEEKKIKEINNITGSKLKNMQQITMNNYIQHNCVNMDFIWNNINTCDNNIIKKMSSMLTNEYQQKINLIYSLLYSNNSLPLRNFTDVINFFYFTI